MLTSTILSSLALAMGALSAPLDSSLQTRAVVNHDSLNPIRTRLGPNGRAIEMFSPLLHIASGCQPYTAVDDAGNISGGLKDTGNVGAGCRDTSKGQLYSRAAWHRGRFAIMYSWYFPKDQPASGDVASGHRHDWECVVVFLDNPANASPHIISAASSGHGGFTTTTNPQRSGNNPKVEYFNTWPRNQQLQFTNTVGRPLWISDWDAMPQAAKNALETHDFGDANVPFKNENFVKNLDKAWL